MEAPLVKVLPNISRIIASPSMKNTGLSVEHLNHHLLYELLAIGIIKSLEQYTIQYSPNIIPDLIFNDCQPSLVFKIVEGSPNQDMIQSLEKLQTNFKNCFALFYSVSPIADWLDIQLSISPGNLKMMLLRSYDDIVPTIYMLFEAMSNKKLLEAQAQYFKNLEEYQKSPEYLRGKAFEMFGEMEIPASEVDILLDRMHTIGEVVIQFRYPDKQIEDELKQVLQPQTMKTLEDFFGEDAPTVDTLQEYREKMK